MSIYKRFDYDVAGVNNYVLTPEERADCIHSIFKRAFKNETIRPTLSGGINFYTDTVVSINGNTIDNIVVNGTSVKSALPLLTITNDAWKYIQFFFVHTLSNSQRYVNFDFGRGGTLTTWGQLRSNNELSSSMFPVSDSEQVWYNEATINTDIFTETFRLNSEPSFSDPGNGYTISDELMSINIYNSLDSTTAFYQLPNGEPTIWGGLDLVTLQGSMVNTIWFYIEPNIAKTTYQTNYVPYILKMNIDYIL